MLTVSTSPLSVERRDWVQGQQTEISHAPKQRKDQGHETSKIRELKVPLTIVLDKTVVSGQLPG